MQPISVPTRTSLVIRHLNCEWGRRTYVMGIINATPDSFSGDGLLRDESDIALATERAVAQGLTFAASGADILDIGGESSRPGSKLVDADVEIERVLPVIRGIRNQSDIPISIDTVKSSVALAALDAGADVINDISALQADKQMAVLAASRGVPVVLMHRRAAANRAQIGALGGHFTSAAPTAQAMDAMLVEVINELRSAVTQATQAGIPREHIIIDPGIGFGKAREENLYLVNHLGDLAVLDLPILLGVSRKAFIGYTLDATVDDRLEGTAAAVCVGITRGADIVRVHDVPQMVRVARMTDALVRFTPLEEV